MLTKIICPYCGAIVEVDCRGLDGGFRVTCEACKQPIAIYRSHAEALQHTDRRIRSISIEEADFDANANFLEIIETQFTKPQQIQIPEGKSLFGRYNPKSKAELQVLTADPSIDRQHCYFMLSKKGTLEVMDNDSMTGTFVNGEEIVLGERRRLHHGDVLTFGATTAIIHLSAEDEQEL